MLPRNQTQKDGPAQPDNNSVPVSGSANELNSWKAIAEYLNVNVRTAQKWETERGLPVRRLSGEKGRVCAYLPELNKWRDSAMARPGWWSNLTFLRAYSMGATVIALAALSALLLKYAATPARGVPALFRTDYRTLYVLDMNGTELWRHTFDEALATAEYAGDEGQRHTWFGDLDDDSRIETLFAYFRTHSYLKGTPLFCFAEDGRLKWKYEVDRAVSDEEQSYVPQYVAGSYRVIDAPSGREKMIAVTSRHGVHHPNRFVLLDGGGELLGEYWHSGHLDYMNFTDLDGDGVKEILLTGINNGRGQATLIALDPRDFTGASDQGAAGRYQISGFPLHKEEAVVFFPRTCINQKFEPYNIARAVMIQDEQIRVWVWERDREEERIYIIYTLNRNLECTHVLASDGFSATHRRLEGEGILDHALSDEELQSLQPVRQRTSAQPSR